MKTFSIVKVFCTDSMQLQCNHVEQVSHSTILIISLNAVMLPECVQNKHWPYFRLFMTNSFLNSILILSHLLHSLCNVRRDILWFMVLKYQILPTQLEHLTIRMVRPSKGMFFNQVSS